MNPFDIASRLKINLLVLPDQDPETIARYAGFLVGKGIFGVEVPANGSTPEKMDALGARLRSEGIKHISGVGMAPFNVHENRDLTFARAWEQQRLFEQCCVSLGATRLVGPMDDPWADPTLFEPADIARVRDWCKGFQGFILEQGGHLLPVYHEPLVNFECTLNDLGEVDEIVTGRTNNHVLIDTSHMRRNEISARTQRRFYEKWKGQGTDVTVHLSANNRQRLVEDVGDGSLTPVDTLLEFTTFLQRVREHFPDTDVTIEAFQDLGPFREKARVLRPLGVTPEQFAEESLAGLKAVLGLQ